MMIRIIVGIMLTAIIPLGIVYGQETIPDEQSTEINTAENFFDTVAARYATVNDYLAQVTIVQGGNTLRGNLSYKKPNLLRIDYTQPTGQVMVSDGSDLWIYLPDYNVVLQQPLQRNTGGGANLATSEGLQLLQENYSIAYLNGPSPVRLTGNSNIRVTKLKMDWKYSSEGFRELILSIDENLLIRRIEATDVSYNEIIFNFENTEINQGVPLARFDYDPPPSANLYTDFLSR